MKSGFGRSCKGNASCSSDRVGWVQGNFLFKGNNMSDLSPITLHYGNQVVQALSNADQSIERISMTSDEGYQIQVGTGISITVYESADVYIELIVKDLAPIFDYPALAKMSHALANFTVYWSFPQGHFTSEMKPIMDKYAEASMFWGIMNLLEPDEATTEEPNS
jgi:hypothetical protein